MATKEDIAKSSLHGWANVHSITTSHFQSSSLTGIRKELGVDAGASAPVDHDSSIFSAAAYFVDLMRLIGQKVKPIGDLIGQKVNPTDDKSKLVWEDLKLDARRPDLGKIRLDAETTTTEVPYLTIVNEVMEAKLAALPGAIPKSNPTVQELAEAAKQKLAEAQYRNTSLDRIRTYLQHFKTDLATIFEAFAVDQTDVACQTEVARECLRLFREEFDFITRSDTAFEEAYKALPVEQLKLVKTFLAQTGLTPEQLHELTDTKFLNQALCLAPNGAEFSIPTQPAEFAQAFSCAHRFIRLANKLQWSFAELGGSVTKDKNGALDSVGEKKLDEAAIIGLAKIVRLKARYNLTIDELTRLWRGVAYSQADGRLGKLASVLSLSANETLLLIDLGKTRKIGTIDEFIAAADCADWLKEARLSVDQLQYIIAGFISPYVDAGCAAAGIAPMLNSLKERIPKDGVIPSISTSTVVSVSRGTATSVVVYTANPPDVAGVKVTYALTGADAAAFKINPETGDVTFKVVPEQQTGTSYNFNVQASGPSGTLDTQAVTVTIAEDAGNSATEVKVAEGTSTSKVVYTPPAADRVGVSYILDHGDARSGAFEINKANGAVTFSTVPDSDTKTSYSFDVRGNFTTYPLTVTVTQDLRKAYVVEALAGFFSTNAGVMRALLRHTSRVTSIPYYPTLLLGSLKTKSEDFVKTLAQTLFAARKFGLSANEIDRLTYILGHKIAENFHFTLDDIRNIHAFKQITAAFHDTDDGFLAYLENHAVEGLADTSGLAKTSGWDKTQLDCLKKWGKTPPDSQKAQKPVPVNFEATVRDVAAIKRIFDLASLIGVDVGRVQTMAGLREPTTAEDWKQMADVLHDAIKLKYPDAAEWENVEGAFVDILNERKRDALAALLLYQLRQADDKTIPDHFGGMTTLKDLSDYLLIDVEMSGCMKISRIVAGLNTLQLYIQRCRTGLEGSGKVAFTSSDGAPWLPITDKEWAWRSHYRLWEANRKVFFYPENFLDPGLRKQKTPLFKELQDELLQGEITHETVTKAYISYFDKLDILANLKIVDVCAAKVSHSRASEGENTLFFVGRTDTDPPVYYYRSAVLDSQDKTQITAWRPWQKIDLSIPVESVACLYGNHRLYIAWVEQKTITERDAKNEKTTTTEATVKYSYHNVSGSWLAPQVFPGFQKVPISQGVSFDTACLFPPQATVANLILSKATQSYIATVGFHIPTPQKADQLIKTHLPSAKPGRSFTAIDTPTSWNTAGWAPLKDLEGAALWSTAVAMSPDGRFLFVGKRGLGILRSDTMGESWTYQNTGLIYRRDDSNIESVRALTLSVDGRFLFAATKEFGVFRSENNGDSWLALGTSQPQRHRSVFAVNPNGGYLFAGGYDGLLRSNDNGDSWVFLSLFAGAEINALAISPDGRQLYAGTTGGIFRSENDGDTWTPMGKGLEKFPSCKALTVSSDGRFLFAGCEAAMAMDSSNRNPVPSPGGGVFRFESTGDIWVPVNQGLNQLLQPGNGCRALTTRGTIVFCAAQGGIFTSDNSGMTWECVYPLEPYVADPCALAVSPDGQFLFSIGKLTIRGEQPEPETYAVMGANNDSTSTILAIANSQRNAPLYRLTSTAVHELRDRLVIGGLDRLLSSEPLEKADSLDFNLSNSYAIYYREIFFHIPFLIADNLHANQRFEDAQRWHHYIFDPTAQVQGAPDPSPYWRYLPFKSHSSDSLTKALSDRAELAVYENDPFDPHAIAGLRLGAYEKAIVMKYIENLLDWGDQLFAQDSWEEVVRATMLYVMAQDLLGKRVAPTGRLYTPDPVKSYADFQGPAKDHNFADPFDVADTDYFPVAANTNFAGYWDRVEDRLFKIRHCMNMAGVVRQLALFQPPIDPRQVIRALAAGQDLTSVASQMSAPVPHYRFTTMILQAKNVTSTLMQLGAALLSALEKKDAEQLSLLRSTHEKAILKMTTRVKERQVDDAGTTLDSLNASLEGAERRQQYYKGLSEHGLSAEEIASVNLMTDALASHKETASLHLASIVGYLMPNIFGLADGGSQFGQALTVPAQVTESLATVSNQASQLAAITAQNVRRKEEWDLQCDLAGHDVDQIKAQIAGATIMQAIAQMDLDLHQKSIEQAGEVEDFLRGKFTSQELYQWMAGRISAVYFQTYKLALDLAQAAERAYQYERNTDDTMITDGYWDSLKKGLLAGEGLMLGLMQLEKAYMDDDERTLEIEKTISLLQLDPLALANFLQLTPAQLAKLLQLNPQDLAKRLELTPEQSAKLLQLTPEQLVKLLELKSEDLETLLQLTPGQSTNLLGLAPEELAKLLRITSAQLTYLKGTSSTGQTKGKCTFSLTERLFDQDFPGHYCRKIKSIAITIPAVVGPYQNVQATLRQTSNRVLLRADPQGLQYLQNGKSDPPASVRLDPRGKQQIAISKGVNDSGMFELNFRDERYLPFEGTGAVSDWELEMPRENNLIDWTHPDRGSLLDSISDVIIHLRYTAKDGGVEFKNGVVQSNQTYLK